jgi:hypothetical protein
VRDYSELLVERNVHPCSKLKVEKFKTILLGEADELYFTDSLDFRIDLELDCQNKMKFFSQDIERVYRKIQAAKRPRFRSKSVIIKKKKKFEEGGDKSNMSAN